MFSRANYYVMWGCQDGFRDFNYLRNNTKLVAILLITRWMVKQQILQVQNVRYSQPLYIYIYICVCVCVCVWVCGEFNKFPDFFVKAFKIVVDSSKFSVLLLYILWDDWPIFTISGLNKQLEQQLEYTLLKPDCHSWWISKMQSGRGDTLEERYAIKFCFKLGKNATETYGMLQTILDHLARIDHQFLRGIRDSRKAWSLWGMIRGVGGVSKSEYKNWLAKWLRLGLLCWGFRKRFRQKRLVVFKLGQWHFNQYNTPVHNSILVIDYLTKMGINTVPHPRYSPELAPCDFSLFPKLRDCRYETIEEMKESVTMVIDTLTQKDFHEFFQKLLERYNKCNAAGGDYFEGD